MGLAENAELAVILSLRDGLSGPLGRANTAVNRFGGSASRVGRGVGQLGAGLARVGAIGATVAAGGLIGAAKAAIDFEDAFAGVRKTVNATDAELDAIARQFRDMATTIPVAATELAAIGEVAGALGIGAKDVAAFTEVVAKLGVTTDLTTDAAAEALGKVGTILGLTSGDFEHFGDVLVNLGNQGASTESEIIEVTKRFAAAGKQAGLTTEQILALSSAATSLGAEPEAAGSALSRIFSNIATNIALADEKGKAFAKVTGRSLTDLQQSIKRGDALPVLLDFLKGLSGLDRLEAAKALKAAGITNVRDRDAILKMAQNLGFVNQQLEIANDSVGALGTEAQKRFDTVASKIQLFRNNVTEAAITVGEGFAPAIGRAAEKLSAFLKSPEGARDLKRLGEDIGKFIDDIDWAQVVDGAKTMVDILKAAATAGMTLLSIISKLPKEFLAIAVGGLAVNKLSGGLIGAGLGNILGGLGGTVIRAGGSRIPGIGAAFAQPVFVTNWPPGLGIGGGIGGAAGVAGRVGPVGGALAIGSRAILPVGAAIMFGELLAEATRSPETKARVAAATGEMYQNVLLSRGFLKLPAVTPPVAPGAPVPGDRASSNNFFANPIRLRMAERARTGGRENLVALHYGPLAKAFEAAGQRTSYLLAATVGAALPKTLASDISAMKSIQARLAATGDTKAADRIGGYITALQGRLDAINADNRAKADAAIDASRESNRIATVAAQGVAGIPAAIRAARPIVNVNVTARSVHQTTTIWRSAGNGSRVGIGPRTHL